MGTKGRGTSSARRHELQSGSRPSPALSSGADFAIRIRPAGPARPPPRPTVHHSPQGRTMSVKRIGSGPRMSQAVVHGNTVYLAGQVAEKPVPSVKKQTEQILKSIDRLLKQAGTDKSKIVSANVWLSDIRTFDEMNAAWDAWVSKGNAPARATVEAKLAGTQFLVEIMVQAAL